MVWFRIICHCSSRINVNQVTVIGIGVLEILSCVFLMSTKSAPSDLNDKLSTVRNQDKCW